MPRREGRVRRRTGFIAQVLRYYNPQPWPPGDGHAKSAPTAAVLPLRWEGPAYVRPASRGIVLGATPDVGGHDDVTDLDDWLCERLPAAGHYRLSLTIEALPAPAANREAGPGDFSQWQPETIAVPGAVGLVAVVYPPGYLHGGPAEWNYTMMNAGAPNPMLPGSPVIVQDGKTWSGRFPHLPSVAAIGTTRQDVVDALTEALRGYVADWHDHRHAEPSEAIHGPMVAWVEKAMSPEVAYGYLEATIDHSAAVVSEVSQRNPASE